MYKKVIKTMIYLVIVFLIGLYVLKFFFPNEFVMVIENQTLVAVGDFIDNHIWVYRICSVFTCYLTYWLYLCALKGKFTLNWKENLVVLLVIIITQVVYEFDAQVYSGLSVVAMVALPLIVRANLKDVAIVFGVHAMAQVLSMSIRGLPLLLQHTNFITIFLMTIECYFWLLLFYLYYNLKRRNENGESMSTFLR